MSQVAACEDIVADGDGKEGSERRSGAGIDRVLMSETGSNKHEEHDVVTGLEYGLGAEIGLRVGGCWTEDDGDDGSPGVGELGADLVSWRRRRLGRCLCRRETG